MAANRRSRWHIARDVEDAPGCAAVIIAFVVVGVLIAVAGCAHPTPAELVIGYKNEAKQTYSVAFPYAYVQPWRANPYILCPCTPGRHVSVEDGCVNPCQPSEYPGDAPGQDTDTSFLCPE